mgnify:CR=1 FL=1
MQQITQVTVIVIPPNQTEVANLGPLVGLCKVPSKGLLEGDFSQGLWVLGHLVQGL